MLDLLATVNTVPLIQTPIFALLKGGIAYRRWQFDNRDSINDQSKIAGEVQAGLGYSINNHANLTLVYQGVFGDSPDFRVNSQNFTGHVNNIPVQNGVLFGLTLVA